MSDVQTRTNPPLPDLFTPLAETDVVKRLRTLSRRGKLPGFRSPGTGGELFQADAFGTPFDGVLVAHGQQDGPMTRLRFEVRLKRTLPTVFAVVLVLTIWPGVLLTDAFLMNFGWYAALAAKLPDAIAPWATWLWYIPLTVLPLPWLVARLRRTTAATTRESAAELVARIAETVDARTEASPAAPEGSVPAATGV